MKRLLLPLLAALALPIAVNAESYSEKEIDEMIKTICYNYYGYVEATKKIINCSTARQKRNSISLK